MKRILVVRFGSLGDVILSSSAVLNLKLSYPESRLTYLTKARFADVAAVMDGVDEVATLAEDAGASGLIRTLLELDRRGFDAVVDLHGNFRSWLTRRMVAGALVSSYPKRRAERRQLVRGGCYPSEWPHTIDLYNRAVAALGGNTPCCRPVLMRGRVGQIPEEVERVLAGHGEVVVIAPGAAHANKRWPKDRFGAVAEQVHAARGAGIIWAVTGADAGISTSIPQGSQAELVNAAIPVLAEVIRRGTVALANDSGVAHLSSAVGTPVAAIFGPTHPALGFAPRGVFDRVIEVEESCRPCSFHGAKPCRREERYCFTRILPERVSEELGVMLDRAKGDGPTLVVDRDGTIMVDRDYLADPSGVELIPGAAEALHAARAAGYKTVVVSNQSGVARGYFSVEAVERVNGRLRELLEREGVRIDGMYYCPHYRRGTVAEFSTDCACRKPSPGMVERAAREVGFDPRKAWVIGDKMDDMNLARVVGGGAVMVRTGHGQEEEHRLRAHGLAGRFGIADDLRAAVVHAIRKEGA